MKATTPFSVEALTAFTVELLAASGMDADKATTVARLLVLTDMMGRRTHGVALTPLYVADIRKGGMRISGQPDVVKDTGAALVWDGDYQAARGITASLDEGVAFDAAIWATIERCARELGVPTPV